ncbi:chemotaxis protein CheX [Chitinispirillales bacterium ANBcel5]|uniref:chemotaxis protein CheX n=1 Tax=Cellulosispirillum alkaliphilum TaxID=3039283 RepID=UPI002A579254|nr:chemotaxis protein CheX [Chitinispirillales bacterium ANBcel5]
MNVSYINPFISSTITCFKTMIFLDIKPQAPFIKKKPLPKYDISGVIGLSGDAQGAISLCFAQQVALKVVSNMVGAEITEPGPDLSDAIGEIANIVAGYAKRDLTSLNLSISLPNIIIGNHVLTGQSGAPTIIVPFTSKLGEFAMEVSLKTK